MKFLVVLFCIQLSAFAHDIPSRSNDVFSYATENLRSRRGELIPPSEVYDIEELNKVLFRDLKSQTRELKRVKYYLMNGELRLAKTYLIKLAYAESRLRPIIQRYLAILNFVEGNFEKSLAHLEEPLLQNIPHFAKICTLKVLNQIVLSKIQELENDWSRCQVENADNFREQNLIWLETLVQLKLHPVPGITRIPFRKVRLRALENDDAKMLLKLAVYLNQERLLLDELNELRPDQLQDSELRELIGQIYFRTGALAKSYRFVEDLKSPNAENIKGNLYLLRTKYELAYAQFKLALEQKHNSQNALERLLPLAWLLGDWENGSKYAEQVIAAPQTQINKHTLRAVFLMQKGDYKNAEKVLDYIAERSRKGAELEVTQVASFNALMQNKVDLLKKAADSSCNQYDLINCWVLFQLGQWDAFPLTIRRDDPLPEKKEWEKLIKDDLNSPLKETVYVNQLDIEELDDKLIQLIKSP